MKQQKVKIRYVATFMKTSKITEPFGSWYRAPVLNALEKVALQSGEHLHAPCEKWCGRLPDNSYQEEGGDFGQIKVVQCPLYLLHIEPAHHLADHQREHDA